MSKDIWHKADERPESFKTFVFKTDKGNTCSNMLSTNSDWNNILLPEFHSMDDFDKAERITKWCYLDDLLALETELERTRKALVVAKDAFNWIDETYRTGQETEAEIWGKVQLAAQEITALEQKDKTMPKQKLKPFDYAFVKMMQEKMGVKFVDSKGKPIEFEKTEQKDVK